MARIWLITGASKGFGLILTLKALASGDKVIAALRNKSANVTAVSQIEAAGGHIVELDVTESQSAIKSKIQAAEKAVGFVDVLVNNAGYGYIAGFEAITDSALEAQFQANVFGLIYTTQAVLPSMRSRRTGLIINLSSIAGLIGFNGSSSYCASKFAVEGLTESMAKEVTDFNIKVLLVEPGMFRTKFLAREETKTVVPKGYEGTELDRSVNFFNGVGETQPGDPEKAVARIWEFVVGQGEAGALNGKINRLLLGLDCLNNLQPKIEALKRDWELCQGPGSSTDCNA